VNVEKQKAAYLVNFFKLVLLIILFVAICDMRSFPLAKRFPFSANLPMKHVTRKHAAWVMAKGLHFRGMVCTGI